MEYGIFNEVKFMGYVTNIPLAEGAKFDWFLNNFLKEGHDYKGLKAAMKKVVDAAELSDEELSENPNKYMNFAKRALQIILDIIAVGIDSVSNVGNLFIYANMVVAPASFMASFSPMGWLMWMIGFILTKLVDRLLRLAIDKAEFKKCKEEAESIVQLLKDKAAKTDDKDLKEKYLNHAKKLKSRIKYYSI